MSLHTDPKFLDIACDVTIRLRGHDSYGNVQGAVKALRRRAPGHTHDECRAVLEFLCQVYDRAEETIPKHPVRRPAKTTKFAEFEDIDYGDCLSELDEIEPGFATREKKCILNWCIFWCYLK